MGGGSKPLFFFFVSFVLEEGVMSMVLAAIPQQAGMMTARRSSLELANGARRASQDLSTLVVRTRSHANPLQLYRRFEKRSPKTANATVGAFCAFLGDAIAQKMQGGGASPNSASLDRTRSATFTAFNFLWMGGPLSSYVKFLDRSGLSVLAKVFATHCLWNPLVYMPCYYLGAGALKGEAFEESKTKMEDEAVSTLVKCAGFWMPA